MLWLTWHMWILILLAFAGGVIAGWVIRGRSDTPDTGDGARHDAAAFTTASPDPTFGGSSSAAAAASTPRTGESSGPASETGTVPGHAPESEKTESEKKAAAPKPAPKPATKSEPAKKAETSAPKKTETKPAAERDEAKDRLAASAPQQAPGADAEPKSSGLAGEQSGGPGAPAPDTKSSPAPDPKSGLAMNAPMQAPGADAGPITDGPQGETSAGPGAVEASPGDDLTRIRGLGPKAAEKLSGAGVTSFSQIASWSEKDVERYDALIAGRGRIKRDDWVGQAKMLAG